ncbi:MAG: YkgJ family cysteine cluster protein [Myxococcota bacterium]|nr:YkgJ family cysteine cluster protein [Myxococcota bacterium]
MSRLGELTAKIDAFFARVEDRHAADMQCQTGCSDCCHVRLTITSVEAAAIRSEVASWSAERRAGLADVGLKLALDARVGLRDRCAALDAAGRCKIYDARPVVCRSHGVPIRLAEATPASRGRASLPVIQACFRNFTTTVADADCVLDQTTLSALVLAVDRGAGGDGSRIELAELLGELAAK